MIRTYSEEMIVLSKVRKTVRGVPVAEILSESTDKGKPREVTIHFFGKTADEAMESLIPGARYTYRGYIGIEEGTNQLKLIAVKFAVIA